MRNKDFIKIINEEISNFDFLGNDEYLAEQENLKLLNEEFFQKQFIMDSITRMREKIKQNNIEAIIDNIEPEMGENRHDDLIIEFSTEITYNFDPQKEPVRFQLFLGDGNRVNYTTHGWSNPSAYDSPPEGEQYISSINWNEIPVKLYSIEGDEINFTSFHKQPQKIQDLFIKSYLENVIENETNFEIKNENQTYNSPPKY